MKKNRVMAVVAAIIVLLIIASSCGGIGDSEYEKAGKEFGNWVNTDPNKWTDTQKDYFNNFMDWADKN